MTRVGESKLLEQTSHIGRQMNGQKVLKLFIIRKWKLKLHGDTTTRSLK